MDWDKKTLGYLYGVSAAATTLGEDRDAFARKLFQAAGFDHQTVCWETLQAADDTAFGLDLPAALPVAPRLFVDAPQLRHPLSGDLIDLRDIVGPIAPATYLNYLRESAERLAAARDRRDRFFALWRGLPPRGNTLPAGVHRGLLDLLPADPRVPLPSVWQHAAVTSAVAGCDGDPAFLSFTIASPQDFIGTSRRTQDFWMGSFLLSLLSWSAMRAVAERCGPDSLVFPDLRDQPLVDLWLKTLLDDRLPGSMTSDTKGSEEALKVANFPNRFTAIVPWNGSEALGRAATEAMRTRFEEVAGRCLNALTAALQVPGVVVPPALREVGHEHWHAIWSRQVEGLADSLGIYWSVVRWDRAPDATSLDDKLAAAQEERTRLFSVPIDTSGPAASPGPNLGLIYPGLSQLAARTLDTRKNLRNFFNHPDGEPGEKCSLCGTRQALHPQGAASPPELRTFWEELRRLDLKEPRKFKLRGRVRQGERLCAVCLTRRLAWEHAFIQHEFKGLVDPAHSHLLFPSAATIATAPFKREVLQAMTAGTPAGRALYDAVKNYVGTMESLLRKTDQGSAADDDDLFFWSAALPGLRGLADESDPVQRLFLRLDGAWLYEESFDSASLKHEFPGIGFVPGLLDEARKALRGLLRLTQTRPSRYYTLIFMDGDQVGKWISGAPDRAPLYEETWHSQLNKTGLGLLRYQSKPLSAGTHLALSACMKHFALDMAQPLVEDHHLGKLVYAGGDDVAVLAPVAGLTAILRDLRRGFQGEATEAASPLQGDRPGLVSLPSGRWITLAGARFTASTGVAIVHHSHPFSHAMEAGFTAMKDHAKDPGRVGRNGYAIHLFKRGGTPLEWGSKWFLDDAKSIDCLAALESTAEAFRSGCLSSRLPYAVAELDAGLGTWGPDAQAREDLATAASVLLRRLLARHGDSQRPREIAAIHDTLAPLLRTWYHDVQSADEPHPEPPWSRLRDLLLLARFLATEDDAS